MKKKVLFGQGEWAAGIAKAVGLDPSKVKYMSLWMEPGRAVTVQACMHVLTDEGEVVEELMRLVAFERDEQEDEDS